MRGGAFEDRVDEQEVQGGEQGELLGVGVGEGGDERVGGGGGEGG